MVPAPPCKFNRLFRGVKLIFTGGHISLDVAFKWPNVVLGLYKYNYSLTRGKELGAGPNKTRWRARLSPWALSLPPVDYVEEREPMVIL